MLDQILTAEIFAVFMVFARVGTAFITMPTIGENFFSVRSRLLFAVMLTLVVAPVLSPRIPEMPDHLGDMIALITIEMLYGAFIGVASRILFLAIAVAGSIIAMVSGLASAMMFNPTLGDQGSLYSIFLTLLALIMFFATNMHHLLIQATLESYLYFVPGIMPPMGDFAEAVARITSDSFTLGLHLSAPFLMVSILLYALLGVMARLMPQMQIFFVALPVQVLMGSFVMLVALGGMMIWFLDNYRIMVANFLIPFGGGF